MPEKGGFHSVYGVGLHSLTPTVLWSFSLFLLVSTFSFPEFYNLIFKKHKQSEHREWRNTDYCRGKTIQHSKNVTSFWFKYNELLFLMFHQWVEGEESWTWRDLGMKMWKKGVLTCKTSTFPAYLLKCFLSFIFQLHHIFLKTWKFYFLILRITDRHRP